MFQLQRAQGKALGGVVLSWVKQKVCCWGRLIGWWGGQMLWALYCASKRLRRFDEDVSAVIQEASTWLMCPAIIRKHKYWWGPLSLRAKDTEKFLNVRFPLSSWIFSAEFINVTADVRSHSVRNAAHGSEKPGAKTGKGEMSNMMFYWCVSINPESQGWSCASLASSEGCSWPKWDNSNES